MTKPILVLAYGNPSRGDDALGPLLLDFIDQFIDITDIELLTDFQLQIEHAMDLKDRELVLFADASVSERYAFGFTELSPAKDNSYTSHAMSPAAVLDVYQSITGCAPPPSFLLSIKALKFELGEGLSFEGIDNLRQACRFAGKLLFHPTAEEWRQELSHQGAIIH